MKIGAFLLLIFLIMQLCYIDSIDVGQSISSLVDKVNMLSQRLFSTRKVDATPVQHNNVTTVEEALRLENERLLITVTSLRSSIGTYKKAAMDGKKSKDLSAISLQHKLDSLQEDHKKELEKTKVTLKQTFEEEKVLSLSELRKKLESEHSKNIKALTDNFETKIADLNKSISSLESDKVTASSEIDVLKAALQEAVTRLEKQKQINKELENTITALKSELEILKAEGSNADEVIEDRKESKTSSLKSSTSSLKSVRPMRRSGSPK